MCVCLDVNQDDTNLTKLFYTNNVTVITECQTHFSFKLPSTLLAQRVKKLKDDYDLAHCLITVLYYIRACMLPKFYLSAYNECRFIN